MDNIPAVDSEWSSVPIPDFYYVKIKDACVSHDGQVIMWHVRTHYFAETVPGFVLDYFGQRIGVSHSENYEMIKTEPLTDAYPLRYIGIVLAGHGPRSNPKVFQSVKI
jgi:hypothetical protein